jgi:phage-related minor tail protein
MRKIWDKYHRGIVASAVGIGGGFEAITNVYSNLTQVLTSAGLDWSSVIPVLTGAASGLGPYAAIIAAIYYVLTKGKEAGLKADTARIEAIIEEAKKKL